MESSKPPKPKNKAERNAGYKTAAMQIFEGKQLLLERPSDMNRDEYKVLRKIQSELIKRIFHKGHSPNRKLQGLLPIKTPRVTSPRNK